MNENIKKIQNLNFDQNNIQKELRFFKDDILKDFKQIETKLNSKYKEKNENIEKKLSEYDLKFEILSNKLLEMSKLISINKNNDEKIQKIEKFKESSEEKLTSLELQLNSNFKDFSNSIFRIDKILTNSVIYTGIIGNSSKFKTFHEFIDFTIKNITNLNNFKDKNILDLKSYKTKLESLLKTFQSQFNNIYNSMTEYTTNSIKNTENNLRNSFKEFDEKIQELRIENSKYNVNLQKYCDSLIEETKKIYEFKDEIIEKFK